MPAKKPKATAKLQEALETLVCEKNQDVSEISVTDLCALANVSRNTFYYHYNSPVDVYNQILKDISTEILDCLDIFFETGDMQKTIAAILQIIKDNSNWITAKSYAKFNSSPYVNSSVISFKNRIGLIYPPIITENSNLDSVIVYMLGGCSQMVVNWIHNGMQTPIDTLSKDMTTLTESLIQAMLITPAE